ncbi:response regulator [Marinibactrum halimedae]|uniref:Response regulator n=1 Tax=Marinibactrum halimedae TaxID=1444977 RepID=A0AA37T6F0_9GAMM|nr:response regulator [Marinibactrum halimedae]MCD9460922.1 response regulator [Marinibactrum halimedae]GLS24596.1 response regulator [Marinibactrum halimedae]
MAHKILVVEDNPDNQKLVSWILEDEGYEYKCAATGEESLSLVDEERFDMVLMDISLPGMDGKETTRKMRERSNLKGLPIIAVTAHAIKGERESILESGVNGLITKPIDEGELLAILQKHLF